MKKVVGLKEDGITLNTFGGVKMEKEANEEDGIPHQANDSPQRIDDLPDILDAIQELFGIVLIAGGLWLHTSCDECRRFVSPPLIYMGAVFLFISLIGILGTLKDSRVLFGSYLGFLGFISVAIFVLSAAWTIGSFYDSGHRVDGLRVKVYRLEDSSPWVRKMLNNGQSWRHIKSCFVDPSACNLLPELYINKTSEEDQKVSDLMVLAAGCCRPPSECGYEPITPSFYNLSSEPISSNKDCKLYDNSEAIKCFDCDTCKAAVVQSVKNSYRWSLIFSMAVTVTLIVVMVGVYILRQKTKRSRRQQATIYPVEVLRRHL